MNEETQRAYLNTILKKTVTDAEFRAKALSDPAAAIKEATGQDLPAGIKVKFVEKLEEVVIVLPPASGSEEITDDAVLEKVAGGGMVTYHYC